ncbi:hypothetical protein MKY91_19245 [Alkalicoccobacillus gibsonii]|uniref:Uncharacterized protein n=1 Tax=Alkalicoccobacillus gibsonii TaxID=79881 RepID=A0ABU9VQ54_9BACI
MDKRWMTMPILCALLLVGCGQQTKEAEVYQLNREIIGQEKEEQLSRLSAPRRGVEVESSAEVEEPLVFMREANQMVQDIQVPTGRYQIADATQGAGEIRLYTESGELLFEEIFYGYDQNQPVLTIEETDTLIYSGFEGLTLTPIESNPLSFLPSGITEVGLDLEPGTYQLIPEYYGVASLELHREGEEVRLFELIGNELDNSVTLSFEVGDLIRLTQTSGLLMERVES